MSNPRRLLTSTDRTSIENRIAETSGKSAYEIAKQYGFEGTEQEWIEALENRPADYIIETGTESTKTTNLTTNAQFNTLWKWEKWNSGKAIAIGEVNMGSVQVTTTWGTLYESTGFNTLYPTNLFLTDTIPYKDIHTLTSSACLFIGHSYATSTPPSNTQTGTFFFFRPSAVNPVNNIRVTIYAVGKWK